MGKILFSGLLKCKRVIGGRENRFGVGDVSRKRCVSLGCRSSGRASFLVFFLGLNEMKLLLGPSFFVCFFLVSIFNGSGENVCIHENDGCHAHQLGVGLGCSVAISL